MVDKTKVFGCDTSHWTGIVDWNVAKQQGMTFMIAKAMDGVNPTKYFVENYEGAKKAGIFTGMYSWLYDNSILSTQAQARAYADLYLKYPTDLPPTIDFEWTKPTNPDWNDLYDFLVRFEQYTGVKCMIYTAPSYWNQYGSTSTFYKSYPLWLANYGVTSPSLVNPWGNEYKLWQFTDREDGKMFGYPTTGEAMADMNYFNGSMEQFLAWIGNEVSVPEVPVEPEVPVVDSLPIFTVTVSTYALNIRTEPNPLATRLGVLLWNNRVDIYEVRYINNDVWGRTKTGWIALYYVGNYLTTWRKPLTLVNKIAYVLPRILSYSGPAIIAGSDAPKQNHPSIALDSGWQNWIKAQSQNREDVWALFSDQWVGPSKGINGNGKLVYIPATWSFNVVQTTGRVSNGWVEVVCIDSTKGIPDISKVNHYTTPTLVSRMTTTTQTGEWCDYPPKKGVTNPWISLNDPIIGLTGTLWLPEAYLTTSCIIATTLNIRTDAGTAFESVGQYQKGQVVNIYDVKNEGNNMWGKTDRGWICLKFGATYYTNWKVR